MQRVGIIPAGILNYMQQWPGNTTRCSTYRRFTMDKIVIVTSNSDKKKDLIKYLKMLFPECEINIQYKQAEEFEDTTLHMKENAKI